MEDTTNKKVHIVDAGFAQEIRSSQERGAAMLFEQDNEEESFEEAIKKLINLTKQKNRAIIVMSKRIY
ncbi:MAG: hypothetical protein K6F27_06375 [Ruminococcus sp.]|nr:hypothetical protein [Ruminococcus sp.]